MPLDNLYSYFTNYDGASFEVFAQQGAEPAKADITAFESRIGFSFPDEFREYAVHPLGGLYMAVKAELWPRPEKFHVGPFWSFLYGLMVYSFCPQAPDWLKISEAWQRMSRNGSPQLVPFLRVIGDADPYCFAAGQRIVI